MELRFSEKKATQAAALFLDLAGGQLNCMALIKDLYLADRESLNKWSRAITNDRFYSMKNGPVLSRVLNLIQEQPSPNEQRYWSRFISPPSEYRVTLIEKPERDQLSRAEEGLMRAIFEQYRDYQEKPFDFVVLLMLAEMFR